MSLILDGTVTDVANNDGVFEFTFDVGQRFPVVMKLQVAPETRASQDQLSKLCRLSGINQVRDLKQFIGHTIPLRVVQPKVDAGLVLPLVVVGMGVT